MPTVGCRSTFAGRATLPRPNPLLRIEFLPFFQSVRCTFRFEVFTGPTTAFSEWQARTTFGVSNPTTIVISTNQIVLGNPLWVAGAAIDLLDYTRGPVLYVGFDGREVQSFQESVPFP